METGTRGEGVLGFGFPAALLPRSFFLLVLIDELGLHLVQRGYVFSLLHESTPIASVVC